MIRILQVVTLMNRGGLETLLMNYYRHIDRGKVQFDFLVHRQEECDYDKEICELGGKIFHLPRLNPFSLTYRKKLKEFFWGHKEYQIIHVHQDCFDSLILKIAKQCGIPVRIAHSHVNNFDIDLKLPIRLFYKKSIPQFATHLMACSLSAGLWMFNKHEFTILPNAIEVEKYEYNIKIRKLIREDLQINDNDLVVGHVGRFYPPKNHVFIIDVFNEIIKIRRNSKLLLVGEGPLKTKIENEINARGLNNNVIFTGLRKDVPNLLQAMDVFLFPSLYEGLGIVSIEAQASGLPVFASTKVPNESDVTGQCTFMELGKPKTWADAILASDVTKRCSYIEKCRKAGYDINLATEWLQNFYLNLQKVK